MLGVSRPSRAAGAGLQPDRLQGRIGLYEVMDISDEVQELILVGHRRGKSKRKAVEEG